MATRRHNTKVSKTSSLKFESVTDILSKLEVEAEKIIRRFVEKAEQSSRDLKKGVNTLLGQVRTEGLVNIANEKKEDLMKIAEEVVKKAKEVQFLSIPSLNKDEIIREAKKNLDELVTKLNNSDLLARAKVTATNTKDQVLSILSIPTQADVVKLSRKITGLENRVSKLTRKAA